MGASGWLYTVPYQEDISKALQELREEVFQSEMYKGTVRYEHHSYNLDSLLPEMVENIRAHIKHLSQ
jgi:hypothetical protein